MADHGEVAELFARYAAAMDDADFERLRDVFTADASFTVDIADGPTVGPFETRDAIVDFISSTTQEQQDQRRHVITNVRTEDGRAAYGVLSLFVTAGGELTVQTTGVYRTELAEEDGRLRFRRMDLALDRPY
jgi:ketosteroid isomerase-like protein